MKIITCYKWVLDEADLRIDPRSRELITDRAKHKISEYDRNAIECGVQLVEEQGGEVIALTVGTEEAKNSLKDVLSKGPNQAVYVSDEIMGKVDSVATTKILTKAIQEIEDYDLIITGEGSSDGYSQQVGIRLAQYLGIPVVTFVNKILVDNGVLRVERKLDEGVEVVEVKLPAVVTVLPDINTPRIPSLKQILAAKKKPVKELSINDLGLDEAELEPKVRRQSVLGTVMERKQVRIQGDLEGIVAQTLDVLKKEGLC